MEPGDLIADRFVVLRLAGRGGMGAVYRCLDRADGATVAVKVLLGTHGQQTARFAREAQVLASMRHPGVVAYVTHGLTRDGAPFLAMEWLEGEDLAARLARTGLTLAESVALVTRVATALAAVHARGVLHRDLKPGNLFLPGGDVQRVKILDFGVARWDSVGPLTRTGVTLGTPGYMAPEQARGEDALTPAADVFALGCVWYECITGHAPFVAHNVLALLARVLLDDAPRAQQDRPDVPDDVDELLSRMLARDLHHRLPDGAAVLRAIEALAPVDASRPSQIGSAAQALTAQEQRLYSVVMVMSPTASAATLVSSHDAAPDTAVDLASAANAHCGRVERLADGSLVVGFGGTGSATDLAALAARCALSLRAMAPEVPIALATGRGHITLRATVGEVIERAAALAMAQDVAAEKDPWPVAVDDVSAALLGDLFDVEESDGGFALWAAREALPSGTRTLLGLPSPFVGREREVRVLKACWEECVAERVARAVVATGPAGAGKSRLREEFVRAVRHADPSAEVLVGRGDLVAPGAPFGLLGSALRGACGVRGGEGDAAAREKVRARVAAHVAREDAGRVARFLGELMGVRFSDDEDVQLRAARGDARLMGDQIRRAWEDWLAAECEAHPVLLVVEDLHWGDTPSAQLIDGALRVLEGLPWMVLGLGRPEVREVFPELWRARGAEELRVGELGARASERLVRYFLGESVRPERVKALVSQSDGNAFYLEEIIRAEAEGRGEATPGSVMAMVELRLGALEPEARQVLRAASVFGRVFWAGGVRALLGRGTSAPDVAGWLSELARREVIVARTEGRFAAEPEYAFGHALLQQAAYAMLLEDDRVLGHRLAGDWLECAGEREALVLAEHFERGGQPERAAGGFLRAAEQALEGNDFAAALSRAARGVACGARGEVPGALRAVEVAAHKWRGEMDLAAECGAEALRWLPRATPAWYRAARELAAVCGNRGDIEQMVSLATAICGPEGDVPPARIAAAGQLAMHLTFAGRPQSAMVFAWLDRVGTPAAQGDPMSVAAIAEAAGARAMVAGDPARCRALMDRAAAEREAIGDLRGACIARGNAAFSAMVMGGYAEAEASLREVVAASARSGLTVVASHAEQNLAAALLGRGALDEARVVARRSAAEYVKQHNRRAEGFSRIYLSLALARGGDLAGAAWEAHRAVDAFEATPPGRAYALAVLADVRRAQGAAEQALIHAREAMALVQSIGAIEEGEGTVRLAFAEALAACGDVAGAAGALGAARERLRTQAARIDDAAWRERFLRDVPENARTMALAREALGD